VLGPILEKHEDVFSEGEDILTLFIFYELTKGTDSYYWPYLNLMPEVDFASLWDQLVLDMCQDPLIMIEHGLYQQSVDE
jgi:hypothetical protein